MSVIKAVMTLFILFLLMTTVLFVDFAYKTFSLRQREVKSDAIVVLTGGRGRVEEGIRLFRANRGQWLFLIGVDPAVRKGDLYRERPGEKGEERVILEQSSRNTLENALYARDLIIRNDIRSLTLITSRYHMKRATLLFRNVLPRDIAIYPHPVDSRNLQESWWSHGGSFRLLFSEFYKYCIFRFFFLVAPGELRPLMATGR